ncbi:MAG: hypothetical protein EPO32_07495 [Anaerolineae bacterium]|nr:MAG: hypothetical protein EPO32_07495 [Anaerolineae bacterium]
MGDQKALLRNFLSNRLRSADEISSVNTRFTELYAGEHFYDSAVILCSALSALSAIKWPGRGIDRARFVEALVRYAPDELGLTKISVESLITSDWCSKHSQVQAKLTTYFSQTIHSKTIYLADELDKDDVEVSKIDSQIGMKTVREYSRANILYSQFRSGLIHEYLLGNQLTALNLSPSEELPSYTNITDSTSTIRRLHLPYIFVRRLTEEVGTNLIEDYGGPESPPLWWVNG